MRDSNPVAFDAQWNAHLDFQRFHDDGRSPWNNLMVQNSLLLKCIWRSPEGGCESWTLHSESKCQQPAGDNNKFGVITTALLSLQGPFRQFAAHKSQSAHPERDYYLPTWAFGTGQMTASSTTATADCVHLYQKGASIYALRKQISLWPYQIWNHQMIISKVCLILRSTEVQHFISFSFTCQIGHTIRIVSSSLALGLLKALGIKWNKFMWHACFGAICTVQGFARITHDHYIHCRNKACY